MIAVVSSISAMKVETPLNWLSDAPTLSSQAKAQRGWVKSVPLPYDHLKDGMLNARTSKRILDHSLDHRRPGQSSIHWPVEYTLFRERFWPTETYIQHLEDMLRGKIKGKFFGIPTRGRF